MPRTVFYAWQSDSSETENHHFIAEALKNAITRLNIDLALRESEAALVFDRDTHAEPGMPPVADTILRKIDEASIFVADVTFVGTVGPRAKGLLNSNVGIELGYAARALGFERVVCVFNEYYGTPDRLPFDLVHRRFPVRYKLARGASAAEHDQQARMLSNALTQALRDIVDRVGVREQTDIELPLHARGPLNESSFTETGAGPIARTQARSDEGRESDYVYWHHGPSAWLRLIPARSKDFSRARLARLIKEASVPLQAFGDAPLTRIEANDYGVVVIASHGEELSEVATEVTQVLLSGEIWGLNRSLIEPKRTQPMRTYQIPWPAAEQRFRTSLTQYVGFAKAVLGYDLPIVAVAGLAMVRDVVLVREAGKWFENTPKTVRSFENFIRSVVTIESWDRSEVGDALIGSLFEKVFDACGEIYPGAG